MEKIDQWQFIKTIEYASVLEDVEVTDDMNWRLDGYEKDFINCKFKDWIFENRVSILQFNNCSFKILKIKIAGAEKIILNNCTADEVEFLGSKDKHVSRMEVIGSETKIKNLKINGDFYCHSIILDGTTGLTKATMQLNCMTLEVHNAQNIDYLVIFGEVKSQIDFKNCRDMSFIVVRDMKSERIEISDSEKLEISLHGVEAKYINFNRCLTTSIETAYLNADNLGLDVGSYDTIRFYHDCNFNFTSNSITKELTINKLIFQGAKPRKDRTLKFEQAKIEELSFDGLQNDAQILFLNCEISKLLRLYQSNLGKFQFTNVKVDELCRIDLLDSNISDVHFNSFRWNRSYMLFEFFDEHILIRYKTQLNFFHSLRESYRQLKANYLKNGNKIEALEFQRGEMEVHLKILQKKRFLSLRNFGNYLIVVTNKLFSDFGQNIWKPIVFLFGFHLLIFNIILLQTPGLEIDIGWPLDEDVTLRGIGWYFQTLLPTHSTEIRFKDQIVSIGGFWDFAARICSGYFIFYFISASRKYHQ